MAGITKLLVAVREDIALLRQHTRKRFGEVQSELDALRLRLDKVDIPKQTQTGAAARRAVQKTSESDKGPKRPVPVPDRPEVMQDAGVGTDPR